MKYFFLILTTQLILACVHKTDFADNSKFNEANGLESSLRWMKVKKKSVDFLIRLESHYDHEILMEQNAFSVEISGVKTSGPIKTNWREVMRKDDVISPVIVLRYPHSGPKFGKGKITIRHLYSYKDDKKGKKLPDLVHEFELNPVH